MVPLVHAQWEPTPAPPKDAPDKGQQALTIHPLDSGSKDTVDLLSPLSQRRNITVYQFPEPPPPRFLGDDLPDIIH